MAWEPQNQYYATNGSWTMTINGKKELGNLKFALFENGEFRGVRDTQKDCVELYKKLTEKDKK